MTLSFIPRERDLVFYVKQNMNGEPREFHASYMTTIYQLKLDFEDMFHIPASRQRIIFAGKSLEDEKVFSDYCIQRESTLYLVESKG